MIREIVQETKELLEKEGYKEFFNGMLKKYGVKSPGELDDAEKKKFFDEVDSGWKGDSEK